MLSGSEFFSGMAHASSVRTRGRVGALRRPDAAARRAYPRYAPRWHELFMRRQSMSATEGVTVPE